MGVDPGTNLMGYALLGIKGKQPSMIAMGVIELSRFESHYMRLHRIYDRITSLVDEFLPDELAIEAPFFGKNVQSMLKLGRAQGVAMAAALSRDVPITEYEPRKVKLAITGSGSASKEQVKEMLRRILSIPEDQMSGPLDATDALGVALCHFYQGSKPAAIAAPKKSAKRGSSSSWGAFIAANPDRLASPNKK